MTDIVSEAAELDAVLHKISSDYLVIAEWAGQTCVSCESNRATVTSANLDPTQFSWCALCFAGVFARRVVYELGRTDQVAELTGVLHRVYHLLEEGPAKKGGLVETAIVPAMTLIEQTAERFPECADMPLAETPVEPTEVVQTSHAPIATFPLGIEARDTISGWEGQIVAAFAYLNGCVRYEIGAADKDGKPDSYVFDEAQIEIVDTSECPICVLPYAGHTNDELLTCALNAYKQHRPIPPLPLLRPGAQYPTPTPAARTGGPRDSTPPPR